MRTILCVTLRRSGNVKLVEKWTVKFDVGKQKCGHDPQKISRDGEMNAKCSSLFSAVVLGYTFLRLHIHTLQCTCNTYAGVSRGYIFRISRLLTWPRRASWRCFPVGGNDNRFQMIGERKVETNINRSEWQPL